jgi:hypothetical protein
MLAFAAWPLLLCAAVQAPTPEGLRSLDPRVLAFFQSGPGDAPTAPARLTALVGDAPAPLLDALTALQPGGPAPFAAPPAGGDDAAAVLVAALHGIPAARVLELVDARLAQPLELAELFALCKALGGRAAAESVVLALELAVAAGPRLGDERLQNAFEATLTTLLAPGTAGLPNLRRSWAKLPGEALAPAVRALAAAGDPAGLELVTERLAFDTELAPELLAAIGTLGARAEPRARLSAAESVLWYLRRCQSPAAIQGAVVCLGRLGDDGAVPELLPLLGSEDEGIRLTAWRALRSLTGLGYPPERESWEAWCREEERWFRSRAPKLFADLESTDLADVVTAIQEVSAHRLHREVLVEELSTPLSDERQEVRRQACIAHQRLGRRSSLPYLEELLADPDLQVRGAVERAIRSIEKPPAAP